TDASRFELADFLEQRFSRQHHTVADVARDAGAHDARRNQSQYGLAAADNQRMACIVAALEAHYALRMISQPVDDLAFALTPPWGTNAAAVAAADLPPPPFVIHYIAGHVDY